MSVVKDFWNFIKGMMTGKEQKVVIDRTSISDFINQRDWDELALYQFVLNAGINIIANGLSKCEVRTFVNKDEVKGDEYYLWNYQPNQNQNASQFIQKLIWTLIYRGECLVVETAEGDLWIAESYQRDCYVYYPDTFRNVSIQMADGTLYQIQRSYKMDEVLFYRLNNQNITNLLSSLMGRYNEMMTSAIQNFYRANGERGILTIDAMSPTKSYGVKDDGTPRTFNDVYSEMMNKNFSNYFNSPSAVMPLWSGFDYSAKSGEATKKSTSAFKDVMDVTDEVYERVGNALGIPPSVLKGDIADVDKLTRNMITFVIDPIAKMIERENNRKRSGKAVLNGTYQMIDTGAVMHVDVFESAQGIYNMVGAGFSLNEIRRKLGDAPINDELADKHMISRNFATDLQDIEGNGQEGGIENGNSKTEGSPVVSDGEDR